DASRPGSERRRSKNDRSPRDRTPPRRARRDETQDHGHSLPSEGGAPSGKHFESLTLPCPGLERFPRGLSRLANPCFIVALSHRVQIPFRFFSADRFESEDDFPNEAGVFSACQLDQSGGGTGILEVDQCTDRLTHCNGILPIQAPYPRGHDRWVSAQGQD